jgi:hypothetical protein
MRSLVYPWYIYHTLAMKHVVLFYCCRPVAFVPFFVLHVTNRDVRIEGVCTRGGRVIDSQTTEVLICPRGIHRLSRRGAEREKEKRRTRTLSSDH